MKSCDFWQCFFSTSSGQYKINIFWDFPGGAMDKTLHSQCRGPRFDPWLGN